MNRYSLRISKEKELIAIDYDQQFSEHQALESEISKHR